MQRLIECIVERVGRKAAEKAGNSASWPYIYQPVEPEGLADFARANKNRDKMR